MAGPVRVGASGPPGNRSCSIVQPVDRGDALLDELLAAAASTRLTATKAHEILAAVSLSEPVGEARKQPALEHADDVAELDVKIKAMAKRIAAAVGQRPSALTDIKGIAAIGTALILGEVGDVRRFRSKHHFASYTGTAPIDVSSGDQNRHRLNRGGNRRLNYALHTAALVQIRFPGPRVGELPEERGVQVPAGPRRRR